jgi:hypothetical protein
LRNSHDALQGTDGAGRSIGCTIGSKNEGVAMILKIKVVIGVAFAVGGAFTYVLPPLSVTTIELEP